MDVDNSELSNDNFSASLANSEFFTNSSNITIHTTLTPAELSETIGLPEDTHLIIKELHIERYCRICGAENDLVNLENIFGERGRQLELQVKIHTHLHLQVVLDDGMPQQVCSTCIYHLNICHHLMQVCQAADVKLRQLFLPPQLQTSAKEPMDIQEEPILLPVFDTIRFGEQNSLTSVSNVNEFVQSQNNNRGENNTEPDIAFSNANEDTSSDSGKVDLKKVTKKEKSSASLLCHICGKHFKSPKNLRVHRVTHLEDSEKKKFNCTLCPDSFRSRFHLSQHMNVHCNLTPYKCDACGKLFHKLKQLRQHSQTHRADKFPCPQCNFQFTRKSNLQAHMKLLHKENRTFDCKLCSEQFPSFSALLSHRKTHSQDDIKNRIDLGLIKDEKRVSKCELCDKLFTNKDSLRSHVTLQHSRQSKAECGQCGKVLRDRRSLQYHRRSRHSTERPHSCTLCGQGFMSKRLLLAHQTIHTGEKPFQCEVCLKGFRSSSNLSQHMAKHKGEKNYQCSLCGKKFSHKGALNTHVKNHSGEKQFVCDVCGRTFTQKICLTKHLRVHAKPERKTKPAVVATKHDCDLCSGSFNCSDDLNKHKEETHNEGFTVVPLIITNNIFETHIVTEDGENIVFTVEGLGDNQLGTTIEAV